MATSKTFRNLALAAIVCAMVCSCVATGPRQPDGAAGAIDANKLLNASPLVNQNTEQYIAPLNMIEMSPEMTAFLDEHIDRNSNQDKQLAQLIYAIIGGGRFLLAYDDSTSTAQEAFNNRRGNCLSFTNMFISMARDLGLKAKYQEVAIPPDWSMTGQSYLFSPSMSTYWSKPATAA